MQGREEFRGNILFEIKNKIMEKYIEELKPVFAQVAEKIGQGAEFGWGVVLKQQYVYAISNLIGSVLALISLIVGIILVRYGLKLQSQKVDWYKTDGDDFIFSGGGLIIGGLSAFILTLMHGIAYLINPEYYALQFFISLVK